MAQGPFTTLPKPPRPSVILEEIKRGDLRETSAWFDRVFMILSGLPGIAWSVISKAGSNLTDIVTRQHLALQDIEVVTLGSTDATGDRHISDALGTLWEDHRNASEDVHGIGDNNAVVGTGTTQTISNKIFDESNKYGGNVNYSEFEADGTLVFNGAATVWKDIKFPMAPPKTTGAGNPTLTTYNGNMRGFSFAVNDVHDFNPEEIDHDAKVGSTATWHAHFLSRSNDGTDRTVKWEIEYTVEPASGALASPTIASAELTITAATAANTPQRLNIATFVVPTIAKLVYARIKRIASSGTEPSVDPILGAVHFHYEIDTIGSREILTK